MGANWRIRLNDQNGGDGGRGYYHCCLRLLLFRVALLPAMSIPQLHVTHLLDELTAEGISCHPNHRKIPSVYTADGHQPKAV